MREWQEHLNSERYLSYHSQIWLPEEIEGQAYDFLPPPFTPLPLSPNYARLSIERHLPETIYMPKSYQIVTATLVRDTLAMYRCSIRFRWSGPRVAASKQADFVMILEGNFEVVTGYWMAPKKENRPDRNTIYESAEA